MSKKGDRVGAILSIRDGEVEFLGFGVYEGDFVPTEAAGWLADGLRAQEIVNPRIKLDNGKVVYGCECWWGDEAHTKDYLSKFDKVNKIDIDAVRREVEATP